MPETIAYGLSYPDPADAPDGPLAFQTLAQDVEGWLSRAWPCTSTTRPTSPPEGLIIRETDTGAVYIASEVGAWIPLGVGASGGGTTSAAQYSASTNQSVPNDVDVAISFGSADRTSAEVVRNAYRPDGSVPFGHGFQLLASGIWSLSTTVRYASVTFDGERYVGIHDAVTENPLIGSGWRFEVGLGGTQTLTCAVTRWFDAGDQVYVHTRQKTGGARTLERGPGNGWVRINLARVG